MPKTYTVKQVADALNFSTNTVYKYLEEGRIKAVRLGTTGRFKIPESELARLLGELPQNPPPPEVETAKTTFLSTPHHLHLFDWFLATTSILLGLVYLIYPLQNINSLAIAKFGLIFAGIYLIACDLISPQKNSLIYSLRTLPLTATYLFLVYNFYTSSDFFNLTICLIIFIFSAFSGKITESVSRFIYFCTALVSLPALITIFIPQSPLLSPDFQKLTSSNPLFFSSLIIFASLAFLAASRLLFKIKSSWIFVPFSGIGVLFLVSSALFLSRIHWTPAIILLTTGTFAFLFPFAARIENQLPLTRKQYLITFSWFMTILSIGTGLIFLNQTAFENLQLSVQTEKAGAAAQLTSTFIDNSGKFTTSFSQNSELISLLSSQKPNTESLTKLAKNFFLDSSTFRRLLIADSQGQIISEYPPFALSPESIDISQKDYFRQAKVENGPVISESTTPVGLDSPIAIAISTPVYSQGKFLGVVVGSLDLDKLNSRLTTISALDNSSFLLIDQHATIFVAAKDSLLGQRVPQNSYLTSQTHHQLITNSVSDNVLSFTAFTQIPATKWTIAIETPYAPSAARNSYLSFAILLTALFLGSGTLTASWYLKNAD